MRLFRLAAVFVASLLATAAINAKNINTLRVNRVDGKVDRVCLTDDVTFMPTEDGQISIAGAHITAIYPRDVVKTFTLGYYAWPAGSYYDGEYQFTGISEVEEASQGVDFLLEARQITVKGVGSKPVSIISLKGETLIKAQPQHGQVVIDLTGLQSGIYIVAAGSSTIKIKL